MSLTQINKAGLDEIALDHVFTIGASGSSAYTFQGEGLNGTVNNPTLYLTRGKTYRFENGSGGHPIRIQSTSGASGTAYNTGVTNNAGSGTVIVEVQHDAPDVLYYQCTSHAAMNGILYITGALADGGVTTAKIADDAVNNDKLANSVVAAIAANTAKTSNATHTGDVTGSTSLTIANNAVTTAKIADQAVTTAKLANDAVDYGKLADSAVLTAKIANNAVTTGKIADEAVTLAKLPHGTSSNDGKFLRANNGADPTFETVNTDLISDTSPQLGGNLASNGFDIVIADGDQIRIGAGNDLKLYHDGSNSYIGNATGDIILENSGSNTSNQLRFRARTGEESIVAHGNGSVELYYDNAKKLETWAGGIKLNGVENAGSQLMIGANGDLALEHDGSNTYIANSTGDLVLQNDANVKITAKAGGTQRFRFDSDGLKFGTDTAAANALDDYEEGTWTPTMASSSGGDFNGSYSVRGGRYTKIGRIVHCRVDVTWSNNTNRQGTILIKGLPFTNFSTGSLGGYGAPQFRDLSGINSDIRVYGNSSWIGHNQTVIYMMAFDSNGTEYYVYANDSGRITGEFIIYSNNT